MFLIHKRIFQRFSIDVFSVDEFYSFISQVLYLWYSKYNSLLLLSCPDSKTSSTSTFINDFQNSITV